jgi:hypothetical protein
MTKKLSALFDLPEDSVSNNIVDDDSDIEELSDDGLQIPGLEVDNPSDALQDALSTLDKIENALPQVKNLESTDKELDDLTNLAINSYKDLTDLGLQVDSRFSAEIFAVAGTMLGHAITAKTAKINRKLKTIELQLKKVALDQKEASIVKEVDAIPLGEGRELDRNELLKMFSSRGGNDNSVKKDK